MPVIKEQRPGAAMEEMLKWPAPGVTHRNQLVILVP